VWDTLLDITEDQCIGLKQHLWPEIECCAKEENLFLSLPPSLTFSSLLGKYMDEIIEEKNGVFNRDNPILFTFHKYQNVMNSNVKIR